MIALDFLSILYFVQWSIRLPPFQICETNRRSHPEVFCEKGVLKSFAKFTGKHRCQGPFFNEVAAFTLATL